MVCCVGSGVIDVPLIAAASRKIFESTSQATDESRRNQKMNSSSHFFLTHQQSLFLSFRSWKNKSHVAESKRIES